MYQITLRADPIISAQFDTMLVISDFMTRFDTDAFDVVQDGTSTTPYVIRLLDELLEPFTIAIQTCASIESQSKVW